MRPRVTPTPTLMRMRTPTLIVTPTPILTPTRTPMRIPTPTRTTDISVSVLFRLGTELVEGADIFVTDAAGKFVSVHKTDAGGTAHLTGITEGSAVTAASLSFTDAELYTVFGVQDGDTLWLGYPPSGVSASVPSGAVYTTLPAIPDKTGDRVRFYLPCYSVTNFSSGPFEDYSVTLGADCVDAKDQTDLVAVAYNDATYSGCRWRSYSQRHRRRRDFPNHGGLCRC